MNTNQSQSNTTPQGSTTANGTFVLESAQRGQAAAALQQPLIALIQASLILKQAHWVLRGPGFLSVHTKLDEIVDETRAGSDDCAERMVTLGGAPDGRPEALAAASTDIAFPSGFQRISDILRHSVHALANAISKLREAQAVLADIDPVSEDLVIGISQGLEKQRWMLEAELDGMA